MELALNILHDEGLRAASDWWRLADAAGVAALAIPDSPALLPDLYVACAVCAEQTDNARIMTGVTNPVSRDPSVTASALHALDSIAPGRIVLGIATGDSALWGVGRRAARLTQLREYVVAVKALLAGEEATYDGRSMRARWRLTEGATVPVHLAVAGPRALRLGAEIADGLIVSMGFGDENIAHVRNLVADGCAAVGRDPSELELWWNSEMVFDESVEAARARSMGVTVAWLTMGSMDGKQIPDEHRDALVEFTADVHDLGSAYASGDRERVLIDRARALGLYDWLISRAPGFWGTPADIATRLREFESDDMTRWMFYVGRAGVDRREHVRRICEEVMPLVSSPRLRAEAIRPGTGAT